MNFTNKELLIVLLLGVLAGITYVAFELIVLALFNIL